MTVNRTYLTEVMRDVEAHFGAYLGRILKASTDYGVFGLQLLDTLHGELPRTECANCGACCNSISIFSLEYHRLIRDLMSRLPPERLRGLIQSALRLDGRLAEIVGESELRVRCVFRDDDLKMCAVHPVRPFACRLYGLRKEDGTRECDRVRELEPGPPVKADRATAMQARIMDVSESHTVYPGTPPIAFFPVEFWVFRFALGPQKALEIYREILIPASTPLTRLWEEARRNVV